ncbi:probable tetratricopeptide repeat protein 37 [Coccomyxa sp. Obi]|nr:probable tetratricopeptide repeat protein 37 [Coccomyxa sp. Obi]
MSNVKALLKNARECLQKQQYLDAVRHGKAALKHDPESYDALVLLGKAAFHLGEQSQAEAAYKRALTLSPSALLAWKGLSELLSIQSPDSPAFIETQTKLLELSDGLEPADKRMGYRRALAKAYLSSGQPQDAIPHLEELLKDESTSSVDRLDLLCKLADAQLALSDSSAGVSGGVDAVVQIVEETVACPKFAAYHDACAERLLTQCRSSGWNGDMCRDAAVTCRRMIRCCTAPRPLEALLQLQLRSAHDTAQQEAAALTARKLAHQFPVSSAAYVGLGLTLYETFMRECHEPSTKQQRRLVLQMLERGDLAAAGGLPPAWLAKARMQLQECSHKTSLVGGCIAEFFEKTFLQQASGPVSADEDALLELRVIVGLCLVSTGQTDRAVAALEPLAGSAGEPSTERPTKIEKQAMRGLARAAAARGDREAARQLHARILGPAARPPQPPPARSARTPAVNPLAAFEHILGAAAVGPPPAPEQALEEATPPDAEHWAHGDYGWFLFKECEYEGARQQLEKAEALAAAGGFEVADWEVAEHRLRLGRAQWELREAAGKATEAAKKQATALWLEAAAVEGPHQALAFAWLGRSYQGETTGAGRARLCFQKALSIDPCLDIAGNALMGLLRSAGAARPAAELCRDIAEQYPEAAWVHVQLGLLLLAQGDADGAIPALQAYGRALELDPARLYSLVQSGTIQLALGAYSAALASAEAALVVDPSHAPARICAAASLLASACIAADELAAAERHLAASLAGAGNLEAALKLLGDVRLCYYSAAPPRPGQASNQSRPMTTAQEYLDAALERWQRQIDAMRAARRAYAKALHVVPQRGTHWGDLAAALQLEAQLRRSHSRMAPDLAPALRTLAERMLRGGLRLAPASTELWACLGACATSAAAREYALSRALALDAKQAANWAALGRLYAEAGQPLLAERCLAAARSHDPSSPAIWEAMGTLAALSPQGAKERGDIYEQAVKLGGGSEALLGLVEGTLRTGRPCSGSVYAAACRCAELQPLDAAAWNALGRVEERRGNHAEAAAAFERAEALLFTSSAEENGSAAEGPVMQSHPYSQDLQQPLPAVRLNLARALVRAGQHERAVGLYGQLMAGGTLPDAGDLPERAADWLGFGHALVGSGQLLSAESAFQRAMSPAAPMQVRVAALRALCQLSIQQGNVHGLLQLLDDSMELLVSAESSAESAAPNLALLVWQPVLAAAALQAYSGARAEILSRVKTWQLLSGSNAAEFIAQQQHIAALGLQASGDYSGAARELTSALHSCPWLMEVRVALAACIVHGAPERAPAASRLIRTEAVERLIRQPAGAAGKAANELPEKAMVTRAAAALTASSSESDQPDAAACVKLLLGWMHMRPDQGVFPSLAAQLLTRVRDPGAADGRAAAAAPGAQAEALRRRAAALLAASGAGVGGMLRSIVDKERRFLVSASG